MSELVYGVTKDTKVGGGFAPQMPAGIHENVELTEVVYEGAKADGSGDLKALKFKFADEAGQEFVHLEFPISMETAKTFAKMGNGKEAAEDIAERMAREQGSRVKSICGCFLEEAVMENINAVSFEDFCSKLITELGTSYEGIKLKIKVILSNKDYTTFPSKTIAPFIARMDSGIKLSLSTSRNKRTGELYERIEPRRVKQYASDNELEDNDSLDEKAEEMLGVESDGAYNADDVF